MRKYYITFLISFCSDSNHISNKIDFLTAVRSQARINVCVKIAYIYVCVRVHAVVFHPV
jgi:hypothetical protein